MPTAAPAAPGPSRPPEDLGRRRALQRLLERGVVACMVLGFYYNSYRYPLQINSSQTSPTYADTPWWLSLGKYVVFLSILAAVVVFRAARPEPVRIASVGLLLLYALLFSVPLASGLVVGEVELVEAGVFFLIPLILLAFGGCEIPHRAVNRVLAVTVVVALVVETVQVLLFVLVGRLPALAYHDSISVRFGSFLDDPNGFGLLLSWMIPFAWVYFGGARRLAICALLALTLLLTQSLTALAAAAVVGLMFTLLVVFARIESLFRSVVVALALCLVLGAAVFALREPLQTAYSVFMLTKAGSIEGHAAALSVLSRLGPITLLGVEPLDDVWTESGYVNVLAYFGLFYLAALLAAGGIALWRYGRLLRRSRSRGLRAHAAGALGYVMAFLVGSLNLPLLGVFPVNLFFCLLLGLAALAPSTSTGHPQPG